MLLEASVHEVDSLQGIAVRQRLPRRSCSCSDLRLHCAHDGSCCGGGASMAGGGGGGGNALGSFFGRGWRLCTVRQPGGAGPAGSIASGSGGGAGRAGGGGSACIKTTELELALHQTETYGVRCPSCCVFASSAVLRLHSHQLRDLTVTSHSVNKPDPTLNSL